MADSEMFAGVARQGVHLGRGAIAAALALGLGWAALPAVHTRVSPILTHIAVSNVVRSSAELCWDRTFDKISAPRIDDFDVTLDRIDPATGAFGDGDRSSPEIYNAAPPHLPLHRDGTAKIGNDQRTRQCIKVPADVDPSEPLRLTTRVSYRGWMGLYEVPVDFPAVYSPPLGLPSPDQTAEPAPTR